MALKGPLVLCDAAAVPVCHSLPPSPGGLVSDAAHVPAAVCALCGCKLFPVSPVQS